MAGSPSSRAHIFNLSRTATRADYGVLTLRGRSTEALDRKQEHRRGKVDDDPGAALHVWHLVAKPLPAVGYGP